MRNRLFPVLALVMVFGWAVNVPFASGFASVPTGSPHAEITATAAEWSGWPEGGVDALVVAVHAPDYEQVEWDPQSDDLLRYDLGPHYDPAHHCDRVPPTDNATAFQSTKEHIARQLRLAADSTAANRTVEAIGAALHALQDCFSHSDYVNLPPAEQRRFVGFLLGNGTPPVVRLVATAPEAEPPGRPNDPYTHDGHAKDSANFNKESKETVEGRTKFEAATAAATHASARLLNQTLANMTAEMRSAIGDLEPDAPQRNPVPGLSVALVLSVAVALVAGGRRTWR